ncbi:MAG: sporulation protein [Lachnospiraceae bacterium]|nr:sporulation protein [Lachnospiraceae bacterium]
MAENDFRSTVETLFKGMDSFITSKTVVGDAVTVGDTIIVPLVDVSFGVGAGAFAKDKKNNGGGGMGGKMTPSAVLVVSNGSTKLIDVKNNDGVGKVLDMVPDIINKFTSGGGNAGEKAEKAPGWAENLANRARGVMKKDKPVSDDPYDLEEEFGEEITE